MTKPISWNTHRPYSETGQLIFAKVLADGRVAFHDATRVITGVTKLPVAPVDTVETHVMHFYDRGYYDDLSSQAWYEMTKGD